MMKIKYVTEIKEKVSSGFNAVEASTDIISKLDSLCQIMFDPENQPPQFSKQEAWEMFSAIAKT